MNIDWDQRREIEDRGTLTGAELQDLIADADSGEIAEALLECLKKALDVQLGLLIVDTSTDDAYEFTLVKAEDEDAPGNVLT